MLEPKIICVNKLILLFTFFYLDSVPDVSDADINDTVSETLEETSDDDNEASELVGQENESYSDSENQRAAAE